MARFIGYVKGSHGEASRLGHTNSGLTVTANGWNIGATVYLRVNSEGKDEISIVVTGGSNGGSHRLVFTQEEGGNPHYGNE